MTKFNRPFWDRTLQRWVVVSADRSVKKLFLFEDAALKWTADPDANPRLPMSNDRKLAVRMGKSRMDSFTK